MSDQITLFDYLDELATETPRRDSFGTLPRWMIGRADPDLAKKLELPPMDLTIHARRLARTAGPGTSQAAAESASRRGPNQRRRVWEALKKLGSATDYELSVETGILRSSAAKRRQELVDLGHVIETPARRKTDTGTDAIVWRCSSASPYL